MAAERRPKWPRTYPEDRPLCVTPAPAATSCTYRRRDVRPDRSETARDRAEWPRDHGDFGIKKITSRAGGSQSAPQVIPRLLGRGGGRGPARPSPASGRAVRVPSFVAASLAFVGASLFSPIYRREIAEGGNRTRGHTRPSRPYRTAPRRGEVRYRSHVRPQGSRPRSSRDRRLSRTPRGTPGKRPGLVHPTPPATRPPDLVLRMTAGHVRGLTSSRGRVRAESGERLRPSRAPTPGLEPGIPFITSSA